MLQAHPPPLAAAASLPGDILPHILPYILKTELEGTFSRKSFQPAGLSHVPSALCQAHCAGTGQSPTVDKGLLVDKD